MWNQFATQNSGKDTVPCDQPPIPLLVLVGTFNNGKEDLARSLDKCHDQVIHSVHYFYTKRSEDIIISLFLVALLVGISLAVETKMADQL